MLPLKRVPSIVMTNSLQSHPPYPGHLSSVVAVATGIPLPPGIHPPPDMPQATCYGTTQQTAHSGYDELPSQRDQRPSSLTGEHAMLCVQTPGSLHN